MVEEHPWSSIDDGEQAEDGVQRGDAKEVFSRVKVADALLDGRIVDAHGYRYYLCASPSTENQ